MSNFYKNISIAAITIATITTIVLIAKNATEKTSS